MILQLADALGNVELQLFSYVFIVNNMLLVG